MKKLALISLALLSSSAFAKLPDNSIINQSNHPIECTQMIGGYCANNPMPHKGYITMLPDPGSTKMTGHIMVLGNDHYIDNIIFTYKKVDNQWEFDAVSLYKQVKLDNSNKDILTIS